MLNIIAGTLSVGVTPSTNSYESIATYTISSNTPSVTFSSIPQTYTHLQLRTFGRTNRSGSDGADVFLKLNSSGTGFYHHILRGTGAAANAYSGTDYVLGGWGMAFTGSTAGANMFGVSICDILDYTNTNKNKTVRSLSGADLNGSGNIALTSSLWNNTNAITSIEVLSNADLVQYTHIALYGIKGA